MKVYGWCFGLLFISYSSKLSHWSSLLSIKSWLKGLHRNNGDMLADEKTLTKPYSLACTDWFHYWPEKNPCVFTTW